MSSARHFAAAAKHAPPKKIYGINGRYAEATYTAASKAGLLDKVASELQAFKNVLTKSPNFHSFLANPSVPRDVKMGKVSEILSEDKVRPQTNTMVSDYCQRQLIVRPFCLFLSSPLRQVSYITRNLFITLSANGKIGQADKVVSAYEELIRESKVSRIFIWYCKTSFCLHSLCTCK